MDGAGAVLLADGLAAPRAARRHLIAVGTDWDPALREAALLLASELVSNAVRHAEPPVWLRVRDDGTEVLVEVVDAGTAPLPPAVVTSSPMPASSGCGGRGLPLLGLLARRWGSRVERTPGGVHHVAWFVLPRFSRG